MGKRPPYLQMPLGYELPESAWRPTPVSELPSWAGAKRISWDLETCDPDITNKRKPSGPRHGAYVTGFGFAIEDGPAHYLPVRHEGGDNLPLDHVLDYLRTNAKGFKGSVVGAHLGYDLDFTWEEDVHFHPDADYRDCQNAEPIIDELQLHYNLDAMAERWSLPGKDDTLLKAGAAAFRVHPKKEMWRLPSRYVGPYVLQDVRLPHQLLRKQERRIEEVDAEFPGIARAYKLECQVLPVLVRMQRRGVAVDLDRVAEIERWCLQVESQQRGLLKDLTGIDIGDGWFKAAALERVLKHLGVVVPRTPTGKPSVKKSTLKAAQSLGGTAAQAADAIMEAREFNKLRTTFCASVRLHQVNGLIHTTFNQLRRSSEEDELDPDDDDDDGDLEGARSGRLSATKPNLQQQPTRNKKFGKKWRSIYRPRDFNKRDGRGRWAKLDYSQQEPRLMVHYAEELDLTGSHAFGDRYRQDPATDFHDMTAQLSGLERPDAKNLGLGLAYGMGEAKLCRDLRLPTVWTVDQRSGRSVERAGPEGKSKMDAFHSGVPFVRELSRACQAAVKAKGFIVALAGHNFHFPQDGQGNYDWLHKALNRLIQGSAAGQTKMALVAADAAGFEVELQVHDELDLTVYSDDEALDLCEVMENVVQLRVPSRADPDVGESWGELTTLPRKVA